MARIFITGSADGLGQLSAKSLVSRGHRVVLHARSTSRGEDALKNVPGAEAVFVGDLSNIQETIRLCEHVNASGSFDVIIHNAGIYRSTGKQIFTVNTLAPYILTNLITLPKRLIYLSSGLHLQGQPNFQYFKTNADQISYSDSKLHVLLLALAVARRHPDVYCNAVNPGWVPTKMGGKGAPDDLQKGYETQTWLATSNEESARVSGKYFHHQKERSHNIIADDVTVQERFLSLCEDITGIAFR